MSIKKYSKGMGWHNDSYEHSLCRRGIKLNRQKVNYAVKIPSVKDLKNKVNARETLRESVLLGIGTPVVGGLVYGTALNPISPYGLALLATLGATPLVKKYYKYLSDKEKKDISLYAKRFNSMTRKELSEWLSNTSEGKKVARELKLKKDIDFAKKDWKKISDIEQEIVWDLPNKLRPSSSIPIKRLHVLDSPLGGWDVVLKTKNKEEINNFDKKSDAIEFADDYMKKH
jgi:hypothetical protein